MTLLKESSIVFRIENFSLKTNSWSYRNFEVIQTLTEVKQNHDQYAIQISVYIELQLEIIDHLKHLQFETQILATLLCYVVLLYIDSAKDIKGILPRQELWLLPLRNYSV
jgi:hypothetical protein